MSTLSTVREASAKAEAALPKPCKTHPDAMGLNSRVIGQVTYAGAVRIEGCILEERDVLRLRDWLTEITK